MPRVQNNQFIPETLSSTVVHMPDQAIESSWPDDPANGLINAHTQRKFKTSDVSITYIRDATLYACGSTMCILDADGDIVDELGNVPTDFQSDSIGNTPVQKLASPLYMMDTPLPHLFYHWLLDALPMLGVLDLAQIPYKNSGNIYIHKYETAFQRQSMLHFGVDPSRVINMGREAIRIETPELVVPRWGPVVNPWTIRFLQNKYQVASNQPHSFWSNRSEGARKLYISRGAQGRRAVSNDADLIFQLVKRGFNSLRLQDYSMAEQAHILRDAECVISAHGAGLANLIFCEQSARVLEFCGRYITNHFRILSALNSLHYMAVAAGVDNDGTPLPVCSGGDRRHDSYTVDIEKIISISDDYFS